MNVHQFFLGVLTFLLVCGSSGASQSNAGAIEVRLVNGSSRYEGTVHYSSDHGTTWHPLCGTNLGINEVKVICRQLGFNGAKRNIRSSPFGIDLITENKGFNCAGGEDNLQECTMTSQCPPSESGERNAGAAVCYDERYLGCFEDGEKSRVLQGNWTKSNELTIEQCINYCISTSEYVYAGVRNSKECYCGDASTQYDRNGKVGDDGCQFHCAGDMYSSCGGSDKIAIFNLSVIIQPPDIETTVPPLTTLMTTITTRADPTTDRELTTILITDPTSAESTTFALLAGVGGGGGFLVLLIIVIVVVFIKCKRRKVKSDAPASALPMACRATEEKKDNGQELLYFDISDTTNCYKDAAITDPTAQYVMPDLSDKSSSRKPGTYTSLDQTDDLSLLYAMPSQQTAKNEADVGVLYEMPDNKRDDHVILNGVEIHTPREGPGKLYGADDDDDDTVMIENEIYNS